MIIREFDDISRTVSADQHLLSNETLEQGLKRCADAYGTDIQHADRMYSYFLQQWVFPASPVLANAGTDRGLPISCFLSYVDDSRQGILDHYSENGWLTSNGGGIGTSWRSLRSIGRRTSRGLTTTGLIPFLHVADSQMLAFNQGDTRRGAYAAYLDVSHPEILEFVEMRKPTGGDINRKNLNIHHGVNISDLFMQSVLLDETWGLVDPHTKETVEIVSARDLWMRIINLRLETGEPYLFFIDTANAALPETQKNLGLRINGSNLCTEIMLATNNERTAVCCLSSLNAATYDEWADNKQFYRDVVEFLDNVLDDFIKRAPQPQMSKAVYSASRERSIGVGLMGFHTYLQSKMVPFDSPMAVGINRKMFDRINTETLIASRELGSIRGEAPDMIGTGLRNAHRIGPAPNATSSIVCNRVSPGIEPINSNSYVHKTKTLNFVWRNRELEKHIGMDEKLWKSIHANGGSVQHLDVDQRIKDVFKTAFEIDQNWIIELASHRQQFIDQGQSVNLFFTKEDNIKYINQVHIDAWKKKLKSLYYVRTTAIGRPENITAPVEREIRSEQEECLACHG